MVLFGPFIGAQLIELKGYSGLFGGTIAIILFTLILQVFFIKFTGKNQISEQQHIEKIAPNMFKDKSLFIPFIAFILLHIGQWMYTMNMPLL